MKFKWIMSSMLALTVSSSAMAFPQVGQTFGADVDHLGTQCVLQEKAQDESKVSRGSGDSDRDNGGSTAGRSAN